MTRPPPPSLPREVRKAPASRASAPKASQRDLFALDSPLTGEIRGERSLMAFPFFALAKNA